MNNIKTTPTKLLNSLEIVFLVISLALPIILIGLIQLDYEGVKSCWIPMFSDEAIPTNTLATEVALIARCQTFQRFLSLGVLSIYGFVLAGLFNNKRKDSIILLITFGLIMANTILVGLVYNDTMEILNEITALAVTIFVGLIYFLSSLIRHRIEKFGLKGVNKIWWITILILIVVIIGLSLEFSRFFDPGTNKENILEDLKKIPAWGLFIEDSKTFAFQYPKKEAKPIQESTESLTIYPIPKDPEDTPLPYMTVRVSEEDFEDIIQVYKQNNVVLLGLSPPINGIIGTKVIDRTSRTPLTYILHHRNKVFIFSLWEGLEWEPFDEVVKSFVVLE